MGAGVRHGYTRGLDAWYGLAAADQLAGHPEATRGGARAGFCHRAIRHCAVIGGCDGVAP